MSTFSMYVAVLSALATVNMIDYLVSKYEKEKRKKELKAFLEHLEDEEADDDEE